MQALPDWPDGWLARRAEQTPAARALAWQGASLDYAALHVRASALAQELRASGVAPGAVVAVHHPGGAPFAVVAHALLLCGATLLPLNTRLTGPELEYQLRHSGAPILLVGDAAGRTLARSLEGVLPGIACFELLSGAEARVRVQSLDDVPVRTQPAGASDAPLALLYTSGTTGRPRAAVLPASAFLYSARASAQLLGAHSSDRWLACMPLFHVGGLSILFRSVLAGSCAVLHAGFDSDAVSRSLVRDGITHVSLVPTMLQRLLDARGEAGAPAGLRCVLLGGAPAPSALLERALGLGYPVAPTYGLTEATSQVATRPPDDVRPPRQGRLRPLPGVELRVVDEAGGAVKSGDAGEILVRGPNVMRGYWRDTEATASALSGGWLRTGDVGCLDEEGALRVLDRRSDLIVSGGENIYPAEVEAALAAHPDVAECAVVGESDPEFGQRPVAFVIRRAGATALQPESLRSHCEARLARYKIPQRYEFVSGLPRTAAGKVRRGVLSESLGSRQPSSGCRPA